MEDKDFKKSVDKAIEIIETARETLDKKIQDLQKIIDVIQLLENSLKGVSVEFSIKASPEDLKALAPLFGTNINSITKKEL